MRRLTGKGLALGIVLAAVFLPNLLSPFAPQGETEEAVKQITILWKGGQASGKVVVSDGVLEDMSSAVAKAVDAATGCFLFKGQGSVHMDLRIKGTAVGYGRGGTIVTVNEKSHPFSFFLRDVRKDSPIWLPAFGVVVTTADDGRTYQEIEGTIRARGTRTKLQEIEAGPEETFAAAAARTRDQACPTWLGVGRDMRLFEIDERMESILPRFAGSDVPIPEAQDRPVNYGFMMGRGWGVVDKITRSLDEGCLPILRGRLVDGDIVYELTALATLESKPLTAENVRGTHYLVADGYGIGHMFTKDQQAQFDALLPAETSRPDEVLLVMRVIATNTAAVPRYAFFRNVSPNLGTSAWGGQAPWSFDGAKGFGVYPSGRVFAVSKLNGAPLAAEEAVVLLQPGAKAEIEIRLPHRPVSANRAEALANATFADSLAEARRYWHGKLDEACRIDLPERRITDMIRAGLLHLDLVLYGLEPAGTLVPAIGVYTAIGSESSPIIQFTDSMGRHDEARRALEFFLDKQHEDGFIQNFGGYMLETGAALWSMGEHYRYTRDDAWVRRIEPKLLKACDYLLKWRQRNLREDLRGHGYGMLEGKTADPEDPFRSFMLNGYAYLGMSRVAEMLAGIDPANSRRLRAEADGLKRDVRTALAENMAKSPVVPLGDGTWCPTAAPWTESRGALVLHADGGRWFTHGTAVGRDSLLGPLYLVFQEVLEPGEPMAEALLDFHSELMTQDNVAFSQPYYSRQPYVHLRRGEAKPFLKAYYNTVSGLADRQTYTFWEHFFHGSPHKTHEEGWFLMETRWMLYMERGDTLRLFGGVPRAYLEDGKRIRVERAASYFGPISFGSESKLSEGRISAFVEAGAGRGLRRVEIRLPHPKGLKPVSVSGGRYDPATETVTIEPFAGRAEVVLNFGRAN